MAFKTTEKGQALIVIALAAVMLFAFASLAIDGSMAFSDKRHAQNAADTSVLAAALAKTHGELWPAVVSTAQARATSNGYTDDGTTIVKVYLCGDVNTTCTGLPAGATLDDYVQVKITSHVKTAFAQVIGRSEIINRVEAIAHVVPGYRKSLFSGQAMVALNKGDCSAFKYGGSGTTTVTGSGIFINSKCATGSNQALNNDAEGIILSVPCYNIVGGKTVRASTLITTGGCTSSQNNLSRFISNPTTTYPAPNIDCSSYPLGTVTTTSSQTTINPGRYDQNNSGNTFPANSWNSRVVMNPGVYCLNLGSSTSFSMGGQQTLTGSNVLIYMQTGSIKWTSGTLNLSAITDINSEYKGLLIAMAPANCAGVDIAGNNGSTFTGTILAPCSAVSIAGTSGTTTTLKNQIISDTITLTGGGILNINFETSQQWQPPIPPAIEMTR